MNSKKTGLYDIHVSLGAKMVEFAGYSMPIQYTGILEEHKRVRSSVGVFDVSHMGEIEIRGKSALAMLNNLITNNAAKLQPFQAQYTAMCYEEGGIVDDLIIYHRGDHYLLVVNAANTDKDFQWICRHQLEGAEINNISEQITQLAVQGKNARPTLQKLSDINLGEIQFYHFQEGVLGDVPMIISRTGYTGEPGFELYFAREQSEKIWHAVFDAGKEFDIVPVGLGARDSLRLEKKYCLYGNDIDQTTNPYEAGLGWITKLDKGDFIGRRALLNIKEAGVKRKLMGFEVHGRLIPRHGYAIHKGDQAIGTVTSGCFSPILEKNIGLGYIAQEFAETGMEMDIIAKGRTAPATIVKTPFV